jgi:hypothetical protein
MPARFLLAFLVAALVSQASPPAAAQPADCSHFRDAMVRVSGDINAQFVRPLVVSRGGASDLDQFDLVSRARIDGVLRCRGEAFVSFEAKIVMPADAALVDRFEKAQEDALMSALGWAGERAHAKVRTMASDAADYLHGSIERGDVYVAGKVEEHEPGGIDLGLIWTRTDRTFVLLTAG